MKPVVRFLGCLALVGFAVSLAGCGKPPQKEINAAKAAIDSAKAAGADVYASEVFKLAGDALRRSDSLVAVKNYSEAKTFALRAKQLADSSITVAMQWKEQRKSEATRLVEEVQGLADSIKAAIYLFKKKPSADIEKHIARLDSLAKEAKAALESGDYRGAIAEAQNARVEADVLKPMITQKAPAKRKAG